MKKRTKTFFITGTDTDVGKTIVTSGLASICCSGGLKTAVMKPIQTGTAKDHADLKKIHQLVPGLEKIPNHLASPYVFKLPASPHLAAKIENQHIDPNIIKQAIIEISNTETDILLIEGAGGVLVPLTENFTILDLLKDLQIPVILTASTRLGTINHTLLTIEALRHAKIPITGIIFNKMPNNSGIIEKDNVRIIEKFAKIPILGIIYELDNSKVNFQRALTEEFKKQDKLIQLLLKK